MRAFIGLELPDSARRVLSRARAGLDDGPIGLRWTRPDNLHLTVRFLGEIDESVGNVLISRLRGSLRQFPPLHVVMNAIAWFPTRRPVVLAALVNPSVQVLDIFDIAEKECIAMGLSPERRKPTPHVTVARLRMPASKSMPKIDSEINIEFDCRELILYRSRLMPTGAVYAHFGEIALGG